ncbi:YraN family protein [Chelativorans sp. Marseille-P2723]|uniref:YraN family protein n=1 Tax=Chelativorans sp. Marseille-P2723 TaxID=2709133 RepID=UPI00156EC89F|nr:YraN family protein [Chelativorans sp. Marseille-P2723]
MATEMHHKRLQAYRRGHRGEWFAAVALMLKGYRIVARRFRTPLGEIDLIARRGSVVAIVEVKVRAKLEDAMNAVGPATQRRIDAAADIWLARQPDYARLSLRYDLIAILPGRWPVHVKNIYSP